MTGPSSPYRTGVTDVRHRDNVAWYDAPLPGRFHRCRVQTEGVVGGPLGDLYQRCPCGAARRNNGRWMDRNTRSEKEGAERG